jgi:hypothetical protein
MKYRISFVYATNVTWTADTPEEAVQAFLRFANRTIYRVEEVGGDGVWEVDAQELDRVQSQHDFR